MSEFENKNNNIPLFSLRGLKNKARIVDVYDGDSITIVMNVFNTYHKFKCRIAGIDSSEMKSKNEECKNNAIRARNHILGLISGETNLDDLNTSRKIRLFLNERICVVDVECLDFDKYGRLLINIEKNSVCIAKDLIRNRLAYEYNGKTKLRDMEQIQKFKS